MLYVYISLQAAGSVSGCTVPSAPFQHPQPFSLTQPHPAAHPPPLNPAAYPVGYQAPPPYGYPGYQPTPLPAAGYHATAGYPGYQVPPATGYPGYQPPPSSGYPGYPGYQAAPPTGGYAGQPPPSTSGYYGYQPPPPK